MKTPEISAIEKSVVLNGLLKIQDKETWVEDINDIIYGYSRAIMLYSASEIGSEVTDEAEHLYILKLISKAFKDIDKFDDILFSNNNTNDYLKLINNVISNYSVAVIETMQIDAGICHERTAPHLLILKDLYNVFSQQVFC